MPRHTIFSHFILIPEVSELDIRHRQGKVRAGTQALADIQDIIEMLCAAGVMENHTEEVSQATVFRHNGFE